MDSTDMIRGREWLRALFQDQARWCREQAIEYPADARNAEAAEVFDRLASSVDDVGDELVAAYAEILDDSDFLEMQDHQKMLRGVGFYWTPATAAEFVSEMVAASPRRKFEMPTSYYGSHAREAFLSAIDVFEERKSGEPEPSVPPAVLDMMQKRSK